MIDVSDVVFRPPDHGVELVLLGDEGDAEHEVGDAEAESASSRSRKQNKHSAPSSSTVRSVGYGQVKGTEHAFTLYTIDDQPYLTLRLRSWAPTPTSLPSFLEGQPISGRVELNLFEPDKIQEVTVSVSDFQPH